MISAGTRNLDSFFNGFGNELIAFYGPSGTGKTTLCMTASIGLAKSGYKTLFIDTQNGFSTERFTSLAGPNYKNYLERVFVINVDNFDEQSKRISELIKVMDRFDLVIIDTLNNFYRKEIKSNIYLVNKLLEKQIRILNELSRNKPIIISNQVYTDIKENKPLMVGRDVIEQWCSRIYELTLNPRKIIERKPGSKEVWFGIRDTGIFIV